MRDLEQIVQCAARLRTGRLTTGVLAVKVNARPYDGGSGGLAEAPSVVRGSVELRGKGTR
jgi:hypothetical protein